MAQRLIVQLAGMGDAREARMRSGDASQWGRGRAPRALQHEQHQRAGAHQQRHRITHTNLCALLLDGVTVVVPPGHL